jgi:ATP-dependent exoDNAse (exonuclease V) beta subunit
VLEQPQIKEILRGIIAGYRKKVDLQTLYDFILENKRLTISEISKRTYEALERRYIQYKRNNYLYDYTDYPLYLYNELNKYGEKIYNTDALFVDELQDVDAEQFHIFDLVEAHKKFYIGDSKQMIYAFRGASPHIFEEVQGFYEYTLHNNYRSKQEIIDYAVTVYNTIQEQLDKGDFNCTLNYFNWSKPCDIKCIRGNYGKVFVANSFGQVNLVNGEIQNRFKCIQEFLMLHPMILCRTNREVSILNSYGYYDCSTIHKAKGLEFNNVIVLDMDIDSIDDLNVAYVGLTRARDNLLVIGIQQLIQYL